MDTSAPPAYERAMTTKVKCDKSNLGINNMLPCPHYLCGGQRNASLGGKEIPCDQLQVTFGRSPHAPFPARGNTTNEIVAVANETVPAALKQQYLTRLGSASYAPSLSAGHSIQSHNPICSA
jgi:hypothetical protein